MDLKPHNSTLLFSWSYSGFAGCTGQVDVVLLLNSAGTVHLERWQYVLNFAISIVTNLDVHPNRTRVGLIYWSDYAYVGFLLNQYTTRQDVIQAIRNIPYIGGGSDTTDALTIFRSTLIQPSNGARANVKHIGILIANGDSTLDSNNLVATAVQVWKHVVPTYCLSKLFRHVVPPCFVGHIGPLYAYVINVNYCSLNRSLDLNNLWITWFWVYNPHFSIAGGNKNGWLGGISWHVMTRRYKGTKIESFEIGWLTKLYRRNNCLTVSNSDDNKNKKDKQKTRSKTRRRSSLQDHHQNHHHHDPSGLGPSLLDLSRSQWIYSFQIASIGPGSDDHCWNRASSSNLLRTGSDRESSSGCQHVLRPTIPGSSEHRKRCRQSNVQQYALSCSVLLAASPNILIVFPSTFLQRCLITFAPRVNHVLYSGHFVFQVPTSVPPIHAETVEHAPMIIPSTYAHARQGMLEWTAKEVRYF